MGASTTCAAGKGVWMCAQRVSTCLNTHIPFLWAVMNCVSLLIDINWVEIGYLLIVFWFSVNLEVQTPNHHTAATLFPSKVCGQENVVLSAMPLSSLLCSRSLKHFIQPSFAWKARGRERSFSGYYLNGCEKKKKKKKKKTLLPIPKVLYMNHSNVYTVMTVTTLNN